MKTFIALYIWSPRGFPSAACISLSRMLAFLFLLGQLVISFQLEAQAQFHLVPLDTVKARLGLYKGDDRAREMTLLKTFADAGCPAANLTEQVVPKRKEPDIICVLPGDTPKQIVIGAHFDHVAEGSGVVDNWSGASLLPSLFQSLVGLKHRQTFVFVGFTGEESGEIGSGFYVKQLSNSEVSQIGLIVTIDSVGMGPTKVWVSRSDKKAVGLLVGTARALTFPWQELM